MTRWLITSSIPYVNAKPHLGFALEIIQADALARFHRSRGEEVRFLTGTDENSISNVRAAEAQRVPVRELVNSNAAAFRGLREQLDLSFDDFIQTSSDPRHSPAVHRLWRACEEAGDIYKKTYEGLYCSGCELYYRKSEALDGSRCPIHLSLLEVVEEENYFFRLSRYEDALQDLLSSGSIRVEPENRRNEVRAFVSAGLEDISISRSAERAKGWGIQVPGDTEQFIYVWFDALVNYISALGYASDEDEFCKYWGAEARQVHVIGKDIIRQHAVYWPAFLLSAGLSVPSHVFVHGFLTVSGQKISKTLGTGVEPNEVVEKYGIDALRYYLLAKVPSGKDKDFSYEGLADVYRSELADQLGNLVSRTTALLLKFSSGKVPRGDIPSGAESIADLARALPEGIESSLNAFDFPHPLNSIWEVVRSLNRYIVEAKPWVFDEEQSPRRGDVLFLLATTITWIGENLQPFLPATADEIHSRLGGVLVRSGPPLFPRLQPGRRSSIEIFSGRLNGPSDSGRLRSP